MKIQQLRAQRDVKARAAHELNAKYPADRAMPADEAERLDALIAEVNALDTSIERELRLAALTPAEQEQQDHANLLNAATRDPSKQSETAPALRAFLTGGLMSLTPQQLNEMRARQTPDIRAAMSTTTNSEGGFTVAIEYYKSLEEAMKWYGGMRSTATVMRTATGATMNFPTADATSEVGEIVGQNTAVALGETTFSNISLDVFKYSSKKIALPFELVQDSFIDIEAYVQGLLALRVGRLQNTHFTTGAGTTLPFGVMTEAPGAAAATGNATSFTYDALVNHVHTVDRAFRAMPGCAWMMSDTLLREIRKIKDGSTRPIFVPGYESGSPAGEPDRLLGYPIVVNNDIAAPAANAKSALFGVLSKYVIRDVMDLTLFRMTDSAFTLSGQIGFVGFMRSGGRLIQSGGAVKYLQNSAT